MTKTYSVTMYKAIHLNVSCEENDRVDIRCGGPPVLGFDFYIDAAEDADEYVQFIQEQLKKNRLPFLGISRYAVERQAKYKPWTKRRIAACIKKGY